MSKILTTPSSVKSDAAPPVGAPPSDGSGDVPGDVSSDVSSVSETTTDPASSNAAAASNAAGRDALGTAPPVSADDGVREEPIETDEMRAAGNVLRGLARSGAEAPQRRLSSEPIALDTEVDAPMAVVGRLAEIEGVLRANAPEGLEAFGQIRQGAMLVTGDAQPADPPWALEPAFAQLATVVTVLPNEESASEVFAAFGEEHAGLFGAGMDIHAFVQWVMRESYLEQSMVLYDYAEKVKFFNEQKRRIREELDNARSTSTQWTSMAGSDENWSSDAPYAAKSLGDDGVWRPKLATEADIAARDAAMTSGGAITQLTVEAFYRPGTRLEPEEHRYLMKWASGRYKNKIGAEDDPHVARLLSLIPKMGRDDVEKFLNPAGMIVGSLNADQFTSAMMSMTPLQSVCVASAGFDPLRHANSHSEQAEGERFVGSVAAVTGAAGLAAGAGHAAAGGAELIAAAVAGGPIAMLGAAAFAGIAAAIAHLGVFGGVTGEQKTQMLNKLVGDFRAIAEAAGKEPSNETSGPRGAQLLTELLAKQRASDSGLEGSSAGMEGDGTGGNEGDEGEPLMLTTKAQLDDYITALEEQLSQTGDDAQLANVNLQNALQRQQQTVQMMSNMSKMLHDTAMAIIRKIGG